MYFCQQNPSCLRIGCTGIGEIDEGIFHLVLIGEGSTGQNFLELFEKMLVGYRVAEKCTDSGENGL